MRGNCRRSWERRFGRVDIFDIERILIYVATKIYKSPKLKVNAMLRIMGNSSFVFILLLTAFEATAFDGQIKPCADRNSNEYFFPKSAFSTREGHDDQFTRAWYTKHLRAMSEPSLSCGLAHEEEIYRFTWLRTFRHPISVRITRTKNQIKLEAKELSGAGGYEPGKILRKTNRILTTGQWQEVLSSVEKANFWNDQPEVTSIGLDGAQWIYEARRGTTYRVIERWTPEDKNYRNLGLTMIKLAEWSIPEEEIY